MEHLVSGGLAVVFVIAVVYFIVRKYLAAKKEKAEREVTGTGGGSRNDGVYTNKV